MLSKLQAYLQTRRSASLYEIAQALGVESSTVQPMLALLMRKGRVKKIDISHCGGCHTCTPDRLEFYAYIDP